MTRDRIVIAGLSTALAATSALAWFALSKTPANAQTKYPGVPHMSPSVGATSSVNGSVVVAYPNGVIAIVKPEGANENPESGYIHVYRVNIDTNLDMPRVESLGSREFDVRNGSLYSLPARKRPAPK